MLSGGSAIRGPYQRRAAAAVPGRGSDGATVSGSQAAGHCRTGADGSGWLRGLLGRRIHTGLNEAPRARWRSARAFLGFFWDSTNDTLSERGTRLYDA